MVNGIGSTNPKPFRMDDHEVFLTTGLTNARTEGTNRLIKQVKRAACGFRNRENYRRRVRLHCTRRTRRLSARNPTVPAQS